MEIEEEEEEEEEVREEADSLSLMYLLIYLTAKVRNSLVPRYCSDSWKNVSCQPMTKKGGKTRENKKIK